MSTVGPWDRDPKAAMALLLLTAAAGGLDATAFLHIGGTFVSNQTGTIVLLAISVTDASAVNTVAALTSLACFLLGVAAAGRYLLKAGELEPWPPGTPLAVLLELVLVAVCAVIISTTHLTPAFGVAPIALAMGMQAALAKRIGLPYLTTGFITGSTTSMIMKSPAADRSDRWWWYGAIPIAVMAVGALATAVLGSQSVVAALALVGATMGAAAWKTRGGLRRA
ncbi:MAG TPA: YoaK family protein [Acidimicrobiales bacterium]|nr:YoaK family protein [Acidimicrobiales bacterium]